MLLSVIFSFKNEEAVIPGLFQRLDKVMENLGDDYEYVFINDASTDRSQELLMERARVDKHVKIVNTSRSFGHDECLFAGFKYSRGDAVVILPPDCQDPPEMIPEMWQEFKKGVDVVYTTRLSRPGESNFKLLVTKLGYAFLFKATKVVLPDAGDFRIVSRRVVNHILSMEERNPFVRGISTWMGFKHKQLFYHREERIGGHGHFPLLQGGPGKAFLNALISYSRWPLYSMMRTGLIFMGGSFVGAVVLIVAAALSRNIQGWVIVSIILFFLSGVHLLYLGFVGLYASSAFEEARGRPNYVVKDTFGFDTAVTDSKRNISLELKQEEVL